MIIKAKPIPFFLFKWGALFIFWLFRPKFNKVIIQPCAIKEHHSYLLMCNHFSFWDGFWAWYLTLKAIDSQQKVRAFYIMILEKQLRKNQFLRFFGCFSIAPGMVSIKESLDYAAEVLETKGNVLLMYPQGVLESHYVKKMVVKEGIAEIINRVKGNCQLLWSSNFVEFFESFKPSIYFKMLDCGSNKDFDIDEFTAKINEHHQQGMLQQYRFTKD